MYRKRKGGVVGFVFFLVVLTIFASGAIAVYVIFMKPESRSQVPQLVGLSTSEAVALAEKLNLVVQIEPVASTLPEGRVLAQSPISGVELRKGSVMVLQVSQGGELHAVPDVRGKTLAKAQSEIKSSGFALGDVIKIKEPNVKSGIVIAQSPASPASVTSGRKIDLLVQEGTAASETITVPDVNRMTEAEARNLLETSGVKVQAVDRVYSPMLPEGLAIETKPGAGSILRAGQGVTLKLATQRRPAGFMDGSSGNSNATVRRVTTNDDSDSTQTKTQTQTANKTQTKPVKVSVGGEDDVFLGYDDPQTQTTKTVASTPKTTVTETEKEVSTPPTPAPTTATGDKTARVRYVVPPIARPMDLRIEITDPSGKREIMNKSVRSGESINTTAKYSQECVISIYLGGEFVWQERQK